MNRRKFISGFSFAGLAILISGCISPGIMVIRSGKKGPPSHAPAHGYRKKNRHGMEMTFDSNLGIYIMMSYPSYYYWDGTYYRINNNQWESSKDVKKHWKKINKQKLPKGLKNK
ncbi:MAG: hypothetical protein K9N29_03415 [Candidatus Marinimicrobia bacterium]|nr:hypothetical protein [Candidatus Neomarinimicrobiota bacterium]